jgi:DNA polymerase-3 subunit delta
MEKTNPLYVCYGPEIYARDAYIVSLADRLVPPEEREFAISRYDLNETPLDAVLDDAETVPFMAERKLVIAHNAMFLTGAKEGKIVHRVDRLAEYLKSPVDYSVIVFTVNADKLDERKKIVKTLKEQKALKPFLPLAPEQLAEWVERRAEKLKITFAQGAVQQLILFTGAQQQTLAKEMEKLSLYAGANGRVTGEMIDELVVRSTEQNVFILIEDIVNQRKERAFSILYDLLKQREEPIKIIVLMARQFRMIQQVKELVRQGYTHQQIAGQIGAHPYPVKLAAEQGRKYDQQRLSGILGKLADLDYRIKSGKVDKVFGLEMLLLEV